MKKSILFLLFAVFSVANVCAQETKKIIYVVDGNKVENFDGSQLIGKTIVNYTINEKGDVHAIFTSDYEVESGKIGKVMIVSGTGTVIADEGVDPNEEVIRVRGGKSEDLLCIIDGKIVPQSEMQKLSPSQIDSIKLIKDKTDPDYIKYSKEAGREPTDIMIFKTK